jgi:ADP-heptose:LPS heptosyltransferase
VPRRLLAHAPDTPDGPEWIEDQAERERWARLVRSAGAPADPDDLAIRVPDCEPSVAGAAVVHVGASYGSRLWPAERFARVANVLAAAGEHVVVTAGAEERDRALEVVVRAGLPESAVLAGRLDLTGLAALVAAARVLVSADTGAAHLASAYRVPSVVIFGPAPVEQWGPPADGPHVVLTDSSLRRGDVFSDDPDPALLAVGSNDVLGAIEQLGFSLDRAAAN